MLAIARPLDDIDYDESNTDDVAADLAKQCEVLSSLRHPNVSQFLGICFPRVEAVPMLVLEDLEISLEEVLLNSSDLSLPLKLAFMEDVARGVVYLHCHTPPLAHRELCASSVFISSGLMAKISSMGNGLLSALADDQQKSSTAPGQSAVDCSMDIWSFGVLSIFILTQVSGGTSAMCM